MRFLIVEKVLTGLDKHSQYGNIRPLWSFATRLNSRFNLVARPPVDTAWNPERGDR